MKTLEKIKERVKANKFTLAILIICFILVGIVLNKIIVNYYNGEQEYIFTFLTQGSGRTQSIISNEKVSQKFFSPKNNLHQIGILTVMPGISTDSTVNIKLLDLENNIEILNQDVFLGSVKDTEFLEIFFENQPNSKNKEYQVIIEGKDGNELNSIQFPYSSYPNDLLGECFAENNIQKNNLVIKMNYTNYISNKLQLCLWCVLLGAAIVFILIFSNDKDLIFKNLNLDINDMMSNFEHNWYWVIPIICIYMLFARDTYIEYYFTYFSFIIVFFILTQVKSIKEKIKKINIKIKVFSLLSTFGFCYYTQKLFVAKVYDEETNIVLLNYITIFIAIIASFIVFALIAIFLDYIWNKIKDVFDGISKKEKIFYIAFLLIILTNVSYMFLNSTAFYGTEDALFDVLFTSDSGRLVTDENVYLSLYHGENDIRQPLFAVFAIPFVGAWYALSLIIPLKNATPLCMNLVQVILFFVANLMLAKLLKLKPLERIGFIILSFCTYMSVLFSVMMEQYLIAYFWLITYIYLVCNKKQDEIVLTAAGGTLLTSLALTSFISNEFSVSKIKEYFISLIKAGIVFVCILIIFNRIDLVENFLFKNEEFGTFIDNDINFEYKLKEYTQFVRNCFIYPQTYVNTESLLCPYSYQIVKNVNISYVGVGIILLAILGFILNRKDQFSIISMVWCVFSYLIIGIIGWGTAENGTILYSLYFGWSFLVLIYKLLQSICNKIKIKNLLILVTIILVIMLININFYGINQLFNFALTYYKV